MISARSRRDLGAISARSPQLLARPNKGEIRLGFGEKTSDLVTVNELTHDYDGIRQQADAFLIWQLARSLTD